MIALILSIFLTQQRPDWTGIAADGWTYQLETTESLLFTQAMPGSANRLWIRFEYDPAGTGVQGARSIRMLMEYDCLERRSRALQQDGFIDNNLTGASVSHGSTDWRYVAPGTIGEAQLQLICVP